MNHHSTPLTPTFTLAYTYHPYLHLPHLPTPTPLAYPYHTCLYPHPLQGDLLGEVVPVTRRPGGYVTSITTDLNCNTLITGDHCKCVV